MHMTRHHKRGVPREADAYPRTHHPVANGVASQQYHVIYQCPQLKMCECIK